MRNLICREIFFWPTLLCTAKRSLRTLWVYEKGELLSPGVKVIFGFVSVFTLTYYIILYDTNFADFISFWSLYLKDVLLFLLCIQVRTSFQYLTVYEVDACEFPGSATPSGSGGGRGSRGPGRRRGVRGEGWARAMGGAAVGGPVRGRRRITNLPVSSVTRAGPYEAWAPLRGPGELIQASSRSSALRATIQSRWAWYE